jgi:hypothetical protein
MSCFLLWIKYWGCLGRGRWCWYSFALTQILVLGFFSLASVAQTGSEGSTKSTRMTESVLAEIPILSSPVSPLDLADEQKIQISHLLDQIEERLNYLFSGTAKQSFLWLKAQREWIELEEMRPLVLGDAQALYEDFEHSIRLSSHFWYRWFHQGELNRLRNEWKDLLKGDSASLSEVHQMSLDFIAVSEIAQRFRRFDRIRTDLSLEPATYWLPYYGGHYPKHRFIEFGTTFPIRPGVPFQWGMDPQFPDRAQFFLHDFGHAHLRWGEAIFEQIKWILREPKYSSLIFKVDSQFRFEALRSLYLKVIDRLNLGILFLAMKEEQELLIPVVNRELYFSNPQQVQRFNQGSYDQLMDDFFIERADSEHTLAKLLNVLNLVDSKDVRTVSAASRVLQQCKDIFSQFTSSRNGPDDVR